MALERIAAAPISWGVCEVPGWGEQLSPDRVLGEMSSLGLRATEAGPEGYLGEDGVSVKTVLDAHGLRLVGGFLPLVLHDPIKLDASLDKARSTAELFADAGADVVCTAAIVDDAWSPRISLSDDSWQRLLEALAEVDDIAAERGLVQVLHLHWGTIVERDEDLRRVLEGSSVQLCLDTGHLTLGGTDPVELVQRVASRIAHVHLKDVRTDVADSLRTGALSLLAAVRAGLFTPLGAGDVAVDETVAALEQAGYRGWYVLEQDTALARNDAAAAQRPLDDIKRSIEFLQTLTPGATSVGAEGR